MDLEQEKKLFKNPPLDARPAPFWFWNDRLDPKRLADQFDRMIDAGMGGATLLPDRIRCEPIVDANARTGHRVLVFLQDPVVGALNYSDPNATAKFLEVANTLRNLFGPHFEPRETVMTGMSDQSYAGVAGEPKRFKNCGLTAAPTVAVMG